MDLLSVIVPCCNEEESLPLFYREVCRALNGVGHMDYELLFIDDGSRDGTLPLLKAFARADERCKYLSFSRNFGKEAAMYAGLKAARGDYTVVMDADLQHPPALLPRMYQILKSGAADCACAVRVDRSGEKKIRSFLSRQFYRVVNRLSSCPMADGAGDFRMMSRRMTDALLSFGEYNRFSKGLYSLVGYRTEWVPYHNAPRVAGKTKWSMLRLMKYAVEGIVSFSAAPLLLPFFLGIVFSGASVVAALVLIVKSLRGGAVGGLPVLVCVFLFVEGLQMIFLGVFGRYLFSMHLELKHRPIFIVKETNLDQVREKAVVSIPS